MNLRIVLFPASKLIDISKHYSLKICEKFPCSFCLDDHHFPHVTLLHIDVAEEQVDLLIKRISSAALYEKQLSIRVDKVLSDDGTYIGLYFSNDSEIIMLREKILKSIKDTSIKVHNPLKPHLTLTRLVNNDHINSVQEILNEFPKAEFKLEEIVLCEQGEHGTCKKILARYPLRT